MTAGEKSFRIAAAGFAAAVDRPHPERDLVRALAHLADPGKPATDSYAPAEREALRALGRPHGVDAMGSIEAILANAALGPLPGWLVILVVALFYAWLAWSAFRPLPGSPEFGEGDVHAPGRWWARNTEARTRKRVIATARGRPPIH